MVLESIVRVKFLQRHPSTMFFVAFLVSTASMWLSYFTFPEESSMLSLAFVTIALVPIMHKLFVEIEREEIVSLEPIGFFQRHFYVILIYAFFFLGIIASYAFWFSFMPDEMNAKLFAAQNSELSKIGELKENITTTGRIVTTAESCTTFKCIFKLIFYNNLSVLFWAFLFSFIYGAGAIFLIGWNASILGTFIGQELSALGIVAKKAPHLVGKVIATPLGFLPHGIPEAIGYFVGAIAGAIISVAIAQNKYGTYEFEVITRDALVLLFFAVLSLFIGAVIEAYLLIGQEFKATIISVAYIFLLAGLVIVFRRKTRT
ncbi:MAG: stage II sporulation protein M [Candidatus Diapherotrites archaeon]|nr:stage II sporulation protein M [Candidatus Diapherotrites archaeon]